MDVTLLEVNKLQMLAKEAQYSAEPFAKLCGLSSRQLQRRFRRQLGCSPQAWLDEQRMAAAGPLLLVGKSIKMVAYDLGFKQASHFCRKFKVRNKMTPSQFVMGQLDGAQLLSLTDNKCRSQIIL